jgi:hypothetical protein
MGGGASRSPSTPGVFVSVANKGLMLDGPGKSGSQSTPRLLWERCHGSGLTQRAHPEGSRWGGSSERHKRKLYHVSTGFESAATSALAILALRMVLNVFILSRREPGADEGGRQLIQRVLR